MSIERVKHWRIRCDGHVTNIDRCPREVVVLAASRHEAYQQLATEGWRINHEESMYAHVCPFAHHRHSDDAAIIFYEDNPLYDYAGRRLCRDEYETKRREWHIAHGTWKGSLA